MELDPVPPEPASRPPVDRVVAWVRWVGAGRLVAGAVTLVAVVGGLWWLLRVPPPPAETRLPLATTAVAPTGSTDTAASGASTDGPGEVAPTLPTQIVVHVAGAVAAPGVYRLTSAARVVDAIAAAGGLAPDARSDAVNLAAPVHDGERVYVPAIDEDPAPILPGDVGAVDATVEAAPVDINRASTAELEALPGIGPATAAAIIDHREREGPFQRVDELTDVRGIGPATLAELRDLVVV